MLLVLDLRLGIVIIDFNLSNWDCEFLISFICFLRELILFNNVWIIVVLELGKLLCFRGFILILEWYIILLGIFIIV